MIKTDLKNTFKGLATAAMISTAVFSGAHAEDKPGADVEPTTISASTNAKELDGVYGMRAMRKYSEDPAEQGIGIFANLEANPPMTGSAACAAVKNLLAQQNIPAESKCRFNQSQGTLTEFTIYIRGVPHEYSINNLIENAPKITADNKNAWLDQRVLTMN